MVRSRVLSAICVALAAPAALASSACTRTAPAPARPAVTGCLALPGAHRYNLRLAPDGRSLYWTEWTSYHGYENSWPRSVLARWPLDAPADAAGVVTEQIDGLFRVLADGRVVGLRGDSGVVVWGRDGASLVSMAGEMDHLEVLDDKTAIYAINGGLWVQPLHRAAARLLALADELLGVDGGAAIAIRDGAVVRIDVATGAERVLPAPPGAVLKAFPGAIVSSTEQGLALQRDGRAAVDTLLTGSDWSTRPGPDAVRAWRKATAAGGAAHLEIAQNTAARLDRVPAITGADGVEGVVRLPDGRTAYLVAQDTDRDGDLDGEDETDLCLAPAGATTFAVPPRRVPRRLAAAEPAIERTAQALGATGWTAIGLLELPLVRFTGVPHRADQQARWRDARTAAAAVVAATGDPSLRIEIDYADGRKASSAWWAMAHRRTAMAGIGGVMAPDPADYDVVVDELALSRGDGDEITCAGWLTNQTDRPLVDVEVDCVDGSNDEMVPVYPTTLRPGGRGRFSGTTTAAAGERLEISVHQGAGRAVLAHSERGFPARRQRLVDAAVEVHDRTRLRYWDWDELDGGAVFQVTVDAPDDFGEWSDTAREVAASTAHAVFRRLDRDAFGTSVEAGVPLRLAVRSGQRRWSTDGSGLIEVDPE